MSTKWNNKQRLQKTPKVCKKQPDPVPPQADDWRTWPLSGYCYWRQNFLSGDEITAGTGPLAAFPARDSHEGTLGEGYDQIEMILHTHPITLLQTLTVTILQGGVPHNSRTVQYYQPPPELPYSAGLFVWDEPGNNLYVEAKVWS